MADPEIAGTVRIAIDGVVVECAPGTSVAAAILNRGGPAAWHVRQSVAGSRRGPLCGMGICFDCLVVIDSEPSRRACMTFAREGMRVETQVGFGSAL